MTLFTYYSLWWLDYFHFLPSSFSNLIRRSSIRRFPHAPTDAEGDEQSHEEEDAYVYPPRDGGLYHVLLQPRFHAGIADGKGHQSRHPLQRHVFNNEHVQDVFSRSTEYFTYGYLPTTLFAREHNHWPYAEEGDENANTRGDVEEFLKNA